MNKKIIASVLAIVFAFSMVGPVSADTSLQDQINALLATIAQLQAQIAGQTATTTGLCLTGELSLGMTSTAVKTLQQGLNQDPATQVAFSGAGSPGFETSYFGGLTKAAVIKFQDLYAPEVLASWGFTKGTGYAGSTTRAKFNALYCTPVTTPTTLPGETTTTSETTTTTLAGTTEGTLTASAAAVYTESTLEWNKANQTIYGFKIKAKNSDVAIKRIYVNLIGASFLPWKDLSYISLYEGSNVVKGIEAIKANFVENEFGVNYDVYFDGLNVVVPKDGEKTFTIVVTTQSTPENKTAFTIGLSANGVRGVDAIGLNQYNSGLVATKSITYSGSRDTATIQLRNNSSTPLAGLILGSQNEVTKDQTIFMFDVKATNNDAILKTAAITLTQNDVDLLTAAYLFDGTTRLSNVAIVATTSAQTITFSDLNVSIAKDALKTLTVKVDIAKVDGSTVIEGSTVQSIATAATSAFSLIDANDNVVSSKSGSASGYTQTIYTAAPVFALLSTPIMTADPNTSTKAVVEFNFTVTGAGDTVYVKDDASWFTVTPSSAAAATIGTPVVNANKVASADYFEIGTGETVTFTISAAATASTTPGMVYASLTELKWNTSAATTSALTGSGLTNLSNWKTNAINMY